MYPGFLSLSGNEIGNAARTAAYVHHALPTLHFRDVHHSDDLYFAVEDTDGKYESPLVDNAPWVEQENPDTWNFYGLYPIEIAGGADGTLTAQPTELSDDGAVASIPRHAGRYMTVRALMVAQDGAGMEAGMAWLKSALEGSACDAGGDGTLCFFTTAPVVNPTAPGFTSVEDCIAPYRRTYRRVQMTSAPKVLIDYNLSEGAMREVTFTLMAGVPFAFAEPEVVADALELTSGSGSTVTAAATACVETVVQPISDPSNPLPPPAPQPPFIADDGVATPASWARYVVQVPGEAIPMWADGVPVIGLTVPGATAVRQVRIRFYPNPFDYGLSDLEVCAFCGEFVIAYIPPESTMTINGMEEVATISVQGGPEQPANHLLYGAEGAPFEWPTLTCGIDYYAVIDVAPAVVDRLEVSLSVIGRF